MALRAFLAALLLASSGAGQEPAQPERAADTSSVVTADELATLLARDARVVFTPDAARRARAVLAIGSPSVESRAVAVLALGCGNAGGDLGRIEGMAVDGSLPERRAALFSLGELGNDGLAALERALEHDTGAVEEALCLALLVAERAGAAPAGARLEALAAGEGPLARRAELVLAHRAGATPPELANTLALWLELRWRAARAYGLVDGQRGAQAFAQELFASEEFLDRVVLAAASELAPQELEVHLSEILRSGERLGALRVAVGVMPDVLARALEAGVWQPSPAAWHAVLDEIEAQHLEKRTLKLLERAYRSSPELEFPAGMLLVRAGGDLPWSWITAELERGDAARRQALVEACGERGDKTRLAELVELSERADELGIAAEVQVALVRLGHPPAKSALDALLTGPSSPERERAAGALARVLHDRSLWPLAERALRAPELAAPQRFALEIGLVEAGASRDLSALRTALPVARSSAHRIACARALGKSGAPADVEALAAAFPADDDMDLNVELALGLLRNRHEARSAVLRAALWRDSWSRSVLAGGLIVRSGGPRALYDELAIAPRNASEHDLRRVGFSLGEWVGLGAVEELARTRTEGDPVLQGAVLGALAARSGERALVSPARPKAKVDFSELLQSRAGGAAGKGGKGGGKGGKKHGKGG
jgi:hypothetical protein